MKQRFTTFLVGLVLLLPTLGNSQQLIVEEPKPLVGYDGGFYLRTADEEFKLKINSELRFQHRYEKRPTGDYDNTLYVRQGKLAFTGTIYEKYSISVVQLMNTNGSGSNLSYTEVIGTMNFHPAFSIDLGDITLPLDRGNSALIESPITATQEDRVTTNAITRNPFQPGTDVGLVAYGDIGKFSYLVGAANGDGLHQFNSNNEFNYSARFAFNILGSGAGASDYAWSDSAQLAIGVGTMFEDQDAVASSGTPLSYAWTSSGDLAFSWRGFAISGDAYFRKLRAGSTTRFFLDDFGYHGEFSYFVLPKKLEIVGRGAQIFREGALNDSFEFGGGLGWYIQGKNLRLQSDYTLIRDYDLTIGTLPVGSVTGPALKDHRIQTRLTIKI